MEKKISATDNRIAEQKEKILECLAESGNVSFACKRVGIVRKTFYRWKEEDKSFSDEVDISIASGKGFVNDLAHNQLIRKIQEGDMGAVKFQLVSCHPDYRKMSLPTDNWNRMQSTNKIPFTPLLDLENMRADIKKRLSDQNRSGSDR